MPKVIRDEALFDATLGVFSERGYQAATTREIARRAGVNEVTLFRRYGSKAALITAALASRLAAAPFAQLEATHDVEADLVNLVRAYDRTADAYGGTVLTLLADASRHPELHDALEALLPNLRRAAEVLRAHQAAGRLRPGDPFSQLLLLLSPRMAAGMWARTGLAVPASGLDAELVVRAYLDGQRAR